MPKKCKSHSKGNPKTTGEEEDEEEDEEDDLQKSDTEDEEEEGATTRSRKQTAVANPPKKAKMSKVGKAPHTADVKSSSDDGEEQLDLDDIDDEVFRDEPPKKNAPAGESIVC